MLLQVFFPGSAEEEQPAEWFIVELQGILVNQTGTDSLQGHEIGTLDFIAGKPTLLIGKHRASGKVAKLPKPLAVLKKVPRVDEAGTDYEVQGFIRRKLVFGSRPQPVVAVPLIGNDDSKKRGLKRMRP